MPIHVNLNNIMFIVITYVSRNKVKLEVAKNKMLVVCM